MEKWEARMNTSSLSGALYIRGVDAYDSIAPITSLAVYFSPSGGSLLPNNTFLILPQRMLRLPWL